MLLGQLPKGWSLVRVGQLVRQVEERVRVEAEKEYKMVGVKWYGEGTFHRETVRGDSLSAPYVTSVIPNALIYNRLFAWKESFAVVPEEHRDCFVSNEFPQFVVDEGRILARYLYLFFMCDTTIKAVNASSIGSAAVSRNRFKEEECLDFEVPLPPMTAQRAIVAQWDKARKEIAAIQERVERLEEGIVTRFYRDLGITPKDYGGRPKAFAVLWKDIDRWSVSFIGDTLVGLDRPPLSSYPYFPLGDIATVSYGIQKSPANRPGQHARPYLRVANVRKGYLDLSEIKEINVGHNEMDAYRLEPRDILFVEGNGSRAELGRVGMWKGEIPNCVHQNHLIKVRVDTSRLLPEYAMTWFNTEVGRNHFFRSAKTSSGLGTINSTEVRNAPIPLPPLEVQRGIARCVEERRTEIAQEGEKARNLAASVEQEVEEMILGVRPVPVVGAQAGGTT
jgi:type I restriction enzyme S subunit